MDNDNDGNNDLSRISLLTTSTKPRKPKKKLQYFPCNNKDFFVYNYNECFICPRWKKPLSKPSP